MAEFEEYPKWLHFEGEASVLVGDEGKEAAALKTHAAAAKEAAEAEKAAAKAAAEAAKTAAT